MPEVLTLVHNRVDHPVVGQYFYSMCFWSLRKIDVVGPQQRFSERICDHVADTFHHMKISCCHVLHTYAR